MKTITQTAVLALLVSLAACGSEPDGYAEGALGLDGGDMVNDASDMAAGMEAAYADLSPELRAAAKQPGDLACGLPMLPDHRAARPVDARTKTFNTDARPEEVAAFYRLAAESRQAEVTLDGPPGLAMVSVKLTDASECTIAAQAEMAGDTNVLVSLAK